MPRDRYQRLAQFLRGVGIERTPEELRIWEAIGIARLEKSLSVTFSDDNLRELACLIHGEEYQPNKEQTE